MILTARSIFPLFFSNIASLRNILRIDIRINHSPLQCIG